MNSISADQLEGIVRRAIEAARPPADPRSLRTVRDVIDLHLQHSKGEVCAERVPEKEKNLAEFAAIHGAKLMAECTPLDLEEFMARPSWKSGWTKNRIRAAILRAFNWAANKRLITENPFRGASKATDCPGRRPMEDEVFRTIMRNTAPHFRRLLTFIRLTGCRPSEACKLRWRHIDWERCIAVFPPSEHKTGKKTGKPRTLFLTPPAVKLLKVIKAGIAPGPAAIWMAGLLRKGPVRIRDMAHMAKAEGYTTRQVWRAKQFIGAKLEEARVPVAEKSSRHKTRVRLVYVLKNENPPLPKAESREEFVFLTLKHTPWTRHSINTVIYRLYQAGVLAEKAHCYGLRHRMATEAIRAGVNLLLVAKVMGHATLAMVQHYASTIGEDSGLIISEMGKIPQTS